MDMNLKTTTNCRQFAFNRLPQLNQFLDPPCNRFTYAVFSVALSISRTHQDYHPPQYDLYVPSTFTEISQIFNRYRNFNTTSDLQTFGLDTQGNLQISYLHNSSCSLLFIHPFTVVIYLKMY